MLNMVDKNYALLEYMHKNNVDIKDVLNIANNYIKLKEEEMSQYKSEIYSLVVGINLLLCYLKKNYSVENLPIYGVYESIKYRLLKLNEIDKNITLYSMLKDEGAKDVKD